MCESRNERDHLVWFVAGVSQLYPTCMAGFHLTEGGHALMVAYDYLDPDLPCYVHNPLIRQLIVEGVQGRIAQHLSSPQAPT